LAALGSFVSPSQTTITPAQVVQKGADGGLMRSEAPSASSNIPANAAYHDGQGNFYDPDGNLVR